MPGTGLGPAIVKDIAEASAAELSFETTGSRFADKLSVPAQKRPWFGWASQFRDLRHA